MRSLILALSGRSVRYACDGAERKRLPPGSQPRSNAASNLPGQPDGRTSLLACRRRRKPAAMPSDFLRAAQGALATGRTGEAQQALEMAQTRMLDRSVPLGQTNVPSDNPTVTQISQALRDLGTGNRAATMRSIETALASATAQGY